MAPLLMIVTESGAGAPPLPAEPEAPAWGRLKFSSGKASEAPAAGAGDEPRVAVDPLVSVYGPPGAEGGPPDAARDEKAELWEGGAS